MATKKPKRVPGIPLMISEDLCWINDGIDLASRTLYISALEDGCEDNNMSPAAIYTRALYAMELISHEPITVILNSPGGSVVAGMAIYDAIRACKSTVKIIVYGQACSMGCVLLQAGDERLLGEHAVIMFHAGEDGGGRMHPEAVKRWVKFMDKYNTKIDTVLLQRMRESKPDLTDAQYKEMNTFDTILTAQEAIDLGLADAIIS